MDTHAISEFSAIHAITAVAIAIIYILLSSLVKEPERQKPSAIILAGAGAAYLNGGLGGWEFPFCAFMTFMAYKGLTHYSFIGIGCNWLQVFRRADATLLGSDRRRPHQTRAVR